MERRASSAPAVFTIVMILGGAFGCSAKTRDSVSSSDVSEMEGTCRENGRRNSTKPDCFIDAFCRCAALDYQSRTDERREYRSIMSSIDSYLDRSGYFCTNRAESECPTKQPTQSPTKVETDDSPDTTVVPRGPARGLPVAEVGAFTIGSSRELVESVQGKPGTVDTGLRESWRYGAARVEFEKGKVVGWTMLMGTLRATISPTDVKRFETARERGKFTLGDTKDDVLGVHGVPTRIDGNRWGYQGSSVEFRDGKVFEWRSVYFSALSVYLDPKDASLAAAAQHRGTYGKGSRSDEVLAIEGVPDEVDRSGDETWRYGPSRVTFSNGRVSEMRSLAIQPLKGASP